MRILLTKPAFSERFFFSRKNDYIYIFWISLDEKKKVPFDKNLNINETKNLKKVILIVFNWRKYEIYNSVDRFLWDMSRNARIGENGRNGNKSPKSPNYKQKFKWDGKGALCKVAILAKMAEMALNCQNRQTVNKNSNEMAKGPFGKVAISAKMAYLAKMAEMAINRQTRQTINKNSNTMAKGPFGKWRFPWKWRIWRKWRLIAKL